jgi:dihydroorotate dehydrogenase electron transfer subunit
MKQCGNYPVRYNNRIATDIWRLVFHAPAMAKTARPGQFVEVRVTNGVAPLLRRPFSIFRVDRRRGEVVIVYRVVGPGTLLLSRTSAGNTVDVLGPLGHGFTPERSPQVALMVAGGLGMAPLVFLAEELLDKKNKVIFLFGNRILDKILVQTCLGTIARHKQGAVKLATDIKARGALQGTVIDLMRRECTLNLLPRGPVRVYTCGPWPMLAAVQDYAREQKLVGQMSLEATMGCGIGTCLGCVVQQGKEYVKVCEDGPVFELGSIDFSIRP